MSDSAANGAARRFLATENAPPGKRAIFGTFPQLGAPIGFILANGLFLGLSLSLSTEEFAAWGWRIPFLASAALVIVGLYVRFRLVEAPTFTKVVEAGGIARVPLGRVFRTSWRQLILGTFIMLATYVLFYLMSTFTLTFGTTASSVEAGQAAADAAGKPFNPDAFVAGLGYTRPEFLIMLIVGVVFFGIFTMVSGPLAERFGRRALLSVVTIGIIVFGLLFVPLAGGRFVGVMAWLILGFSLMGLTFGPMGAQLAGAVRHQRALHGLGVSYNVSSIIGAAVAPFIAVALWQAADGSIFFVGALPVAGGGDHARGAAVVEGVAGLGLHDDCGVAGAQRAVVRAGAFATT